ncbi:MAG: type I restriction-modification system subunit M N-terminal domain-containing protein [Leadbetterella sp.]|nr:type I restriction-modification system subunit M N-terminal domain-containing protein [Leadbetterella sp.]
MSIDQKKQLEQQLWNIANTLRGLMDADEFRDYILGFIFYKYLSEKMELNANKILSESGETIKYREINENTVDGQEFLEAIKEETVESLGYFLKPSELFSQIAARGGQSEESAESGGKGSENSSDSFILGDLALILRNMHIANIEAIYEFWVMLKQNQPTLITNFFKIKRLLKYKTDLEITL